MNLEEVTRQPAGGPAQGHHKQHQQHQQQHQTTTRSSNGRTDGRPARATSFCFVRVALPPTVTLHQPVESKILVVTDFHINLEEKVKSF